MEDFNGLASSLAAGVADVRGCLIVSRDGLVLGSDPEDSETEIKSAWVRFAALGDPERGFAQFGTETWCYVRRGPYAAFAVVGLGARPGLVIDHMEQVLLAAEETRNSREGIRAEAPAPVATAPTGKPRSSLHPESRAVDEPIVITADVGPPAEAAAVETSVETLAAQEGPPPSETRDGLGQPSGKKRPPGGVFGDGDEEEGDVDRFSLAREFGQLLQEGEAGADG